MFFTHLGNKSKYRRKGSYTSHMLLSPT